MRSVHPLRINVCYFNSNTDKYYFTWLFEFRQKYLNNIAKIKFLSEYSEKIWQHLSKLRTKRFSVIWLKTELPIVKKFIYVHFLRGCRFSPILLQKKISQDQQNGCFCLAYRCFHHPVGCSGHRLPIFCPQGAQQRVSKYTPSLSGLVSLVHNWYFAFYPIPGSSRWCWSLRQRPAGYCKYLSVNVNLMRSCAYRTALVFPSEIILFFATCSQLGSSNFRRG